MGQNFADGIGDDKTGGEIPGHGGFVQQHQFPAPVIVDEPGSRVDIEGGAADDEYIRRSDAEVIRIRAKEGHVITTCMDGEIMRSEEVTMRLSDKKINFFGLPAAVEAKEEVPV